MADMSQTVALLNKTICDMATSEKGAHAETAVAAAGRMAGTFLFRSFNLPIDAIEPGAPVLSDKANEHGPKLIDTFSQVLASMKVPADWRHVGAETGPQHAPLLSLMQTQERLAAPFLKVASDEKYTDYDMAMVCALTAAQLVRDTMAVLDPAIAIGLATYGFVEGSKTAPIRALRAPVKKKGWFSR
jgi:hypothetical protein